MSTSIQKIRSSSNLNTLASNVATYLEVLTDKINKHEARIGKNSVDNADQDEKLGGFVTSISDFRTSIASLQDQVAFFSFSFFLCYEVSRSFVVVFINNGFVSDEN